MKNYSFADGYGNSITEGLQTNDPETFAREWLAASPGHACVEYWETSDRSEDGKPGESVRTVWR